MYYRKKWGKHQRIVHTYGEEDGSTDEEERRTEMEQHLRDGTARHCIPGDNTVDQPRQHGHCAWADSKESVQMWISDASAYFT